MDALPAFEDTLLPSRNGDVLELDKLWSFVQKKEQECCLWIALCRHTRQVVAYTIGDRRQEGAMSLRAHVPKDYHRRATRSDFWLAYEAAFPQRTHRFCGKEEGETNHAERFFGTLRSRLSRLVHKTYSFSKRFARHLETIYLFIASYTISPSSRQPRFKRYQLGYGGLLLSGYKYHWIYYHENEFARSNNYVNGFEIFWSFAKFCSHCTT